MKSIIGYITTALCISLLCFLPVKAEQSTAPDLYGIGSVSKVFTASAVMRLSDFGLVDLDAPVTEYIPEFTMADERYTEITPRMLLNHSSGLYGMTDNNALLLGDNSTYAHDNLLKNLKTQKLKHQPGDRSIYCNDGFTLAEILVEQVSGNTFMDFLKSEFFIPLGIEDIYAPTDTFDRSRLAPATFGSLNLAEENLNLIGSGGLYAAAEELCRFAEIFNGASDLLSEKSLQEMMAFECRGAFSDASDHTIFGYGLGWDSVNTYPFEEMGIKALAKGGSTSFYHSNLTVLPEQQLSVAVVSSGQAGYEQLIAQEIILAVLEEEGLTGNTEIELPKRTAVPKPIEKKWLAYAGLYLGQSLMNASFEGDELVITPLGVKNERSFRFLHTGNGVFLSQDGDYAGLGSFMAAEGGNTGMTELRFVENELGEQFLYADGYMEIAGLSQTAMSLPFAQRAEATDIDENVLAAWKQREDQNYLLVNETFSSSQYLHGPVARLYVDERGYIQEGVYDTAGFSFTGARIETETKALPCQNTPVQIGRDANEISFFQLDGKELLDIRGYQFINEADVMESSDVGRSVVIPENGQSQWLRMSEDRKEDQWNVKLPDQGSYFAYDSDFECIASSLEQDARSMIELPENGYLVFAGEPGSVFTIER